MNASKWFLFGFSTAVILAGVCFIFFNIQRVRQVADVKRELQAAKSARGRAEGIADEARRTAQIFREENQGLRIHVRELGAHLHAIKSTNQQLDNGIRDIESILRSSDNIIDDLIRHFKDKEEERRNYVLR